MKANFDKKTIEQIQNITLNNYDFDEQGDADIETCESIIYDLLLEYNDMKEEYENFVEKMTDKGYYD